MKLKLLLFTLLCFVCISAGAYSFDIPNYTVETRFKANDISASIMFSHQTSSNFYMLQYNIEQEGNPRLRPHHWNGGPSCDAEIELNQFFDDIDLTQWHVTKITVTNGNHYKVYLDDVQIYESDEVGGETLAFGSIGTRAAWSGDIGESADFDYFKITNDDTQEIIYENNFDDPSKAFQNGTVSDGVYHAVGSKDNEKRGLPVDPILSAVKDMHYAVEADITLLENCASIIFGRTDNDTYYMWQLGQSGDDAFIRYHLANGNESWKAVGDGKAFPDFNAADLIGTKHRIKIEVLGNVVYTYIDDKLQDVFPQNDMTDLALLNNGEIGLRVDGKDFSQRAYIDNIKLTQYYEDGCQNVLVDDDFENVYGMGEYTKYFYIDPANAGYAEVVDDGTGNNVLYLNGTSGSETAFTRIVETYKLDYSENGDNYTGAIEDIRAVVDRHLSADYWNTICLPFDMDKALIEHVFGKGTLVTELSSVEDETMMFTNSDMIKAGVPYLIKPARNIHNGFVVPNVSATVETPLKSEFGAYAFVGVYDPVTLQTDGSQRTINKNLALDIPTADNSLLKGLRAYFQVPADKDVKLNINGITTDITSVNAGETDSDSVYNLSGVRIKNKDLTKGIYIINGKKIIKK